MKKRERKNERERERERERESERKRGENGEVSLPTLRHASRHECTWQQFVLPGGCQCARQLE